MNYIVNPMIFYWMSVLDSIKTVSILFLILSAVGIVICVVESCTDGSWRDEDDMALFKKWKRVVIAIFTVSVLLVVFIPSEKTMTEMLIAKFATVENANWTLENVKNAVDYIVEAMKTLK